MGVVVAIRCYYGLGTVLNSLFILTRLILTITLGDWFYDYSHFVDEEAETYD